MASFDGLLIGALQKPQRERRPFLSSSLALVLHALTERRGRDRRATLGRTLP